MKRLIAIIALSCVYAITWLISVTLRSVIRSRTRRNRIIINGTFHNPNWFHAHITPLAASGYGEVILVCDEPVAPLENLEYACPPIWATRLFSRAGAKFLWTFGISITRPADIYVGYHIFPSAVTALICARSFGARAIYQVTSGPLELEGGGWQAENAVLVALGGPSSLVEKLALAVTRQMDLAIVRGSNAANYLRTNGFEAALEAVTGSVDTDHPIPKDKPIDLIFVGRLAEYKRPDRLIEVIARVVRSVPGCRAVLVGDGPDRTSLEQQVRSLNLENNVEFLGQRSDVNDLVAQAKIFTLTSRWEGVSIAMLEAMAMRAVPVVSDVGDLADYAISGETGFVIAPDDMDTFAEKISMLLGDDEVRERFATAAREKVVANCDRQLLSTRWRKILETLTDMPENTS